ncbi:MAG: translation initiation factor IF-2, partial [Ilumatobacteraceae bacterium]|nr:translation initiation factor IF-2 [Ilumatobacteraceae bacterium]
MSNQETLDLCGKMGIGVKTQSSTIIDQQADRVRTKAQREGLVRDVQPEEPKAVKKAVKKAAAKKSDGDASEKTPVKKAAAKKAVAKKAVAKKAVAKKAVAEKPSPDVSEPASTSASADVV